MMNRFQSYAAMAYANGQFADLSSIEAWRKEVVQLGDRLFEHVLVELSTREGCESWSEAIKRINEAVRELEQVLEVLEEARSAEFPKSLSGASPHAIAAQSAFPDCKRT